MFNPKIDQVMKMWEQFHQRHHEEVQETTLWWEEVWLPDGSVQPLPRIWTLWKH